MLIKIHRICFLLSIVPLISFSHGRKNCASKSVEQIICNEQYITYKTNLKPYKICWYSEGMLIKKSYAFHSKVPFDLRKNIPLGTGDNEMFLPWEIFIDSAKNIYFSDYYSEIKKLDADGLTCKTLFKSNYRRNDSRKKLSFFDEDLNCYVFSDSIVFPSFYNGVIRKFNSNGKSVNLFNTNLWRTPSWSIFVNKQKEVYVLNKSYEFGNNNMSLNRAIPSDTIDYHPEFGVFYEKPKEYIIQTFLDYNDSVYSNFALKNQIVKLQKKSSEVDIIRTSIHYGSWTSDVFLPNIFDFYIDRFGNIYSAQNGQGARPGYILKWAKEDTAPTIIIPEIDPYSLDFDCDGNLYSNNSFGLERYDSNIDDTLILNSMTNVKTVIYFFDGDSLILNYDKQADKSLSVYLGKDTIFCDTPFVLTASVLNNKGSVFYNWSNGDTTSSIQVSQAGNFYCIASDNYCIARDTINVKLSTLIKFEKIDDVLLTCDEIKREVSIFIGDNYIYKWNDNSGNFLRFVEPDKNYIYTISDQCNEVTDTFNVSKEECDCTFILPKIFTPNGDNINDLWYPKVNCKKGNLDFSYIIRNRFGEVVAIGNMNSPYWNGLYKGMHQPQGTYIVDVSIINIDGSTSRKQEVLTLVR